MQIIPALILSFLISEYVWVIRLISLKPWDSFIFVSRIHSRSSGIAPSYILTLILSIISKLRKLAFTTRAQCCRILNLIWFNLLLHFNELSFATSTKRNSTVFASISPDLDFMPASTVNNTLGVAKLGLILLNHLEWRLVLL